MRTTVRLDDGLLERARREAARRGTTLTALIDEGLRTVLRRPHRGKHPPRPPLPRSSAGGGLQPGADLDNSAALLDRMESGG